MRCLKVTFSANVIDCSQIEGVDDQKDYTVARSLGAQLKKQAEQGVQYRSVRNIGATCWGLFSPKHVATAIQTKHFEFIFDGQAMSKVRELVKG